MAFELLQSSQERVSPWQKIFSFFTYFLALAVIGIYGFLLFQSFAKNKEINALDAKISGLESLQNKTYESTVLDYKKKISDYEMIIGKHKISSHVFNFIEQTTLPNVWFSSFDMSGSTNILTLSGESENMASLSNQIQTFEKHSEYIKDITVLNSQTELSGRVKFTISFQLQPKVFNWTVKKN